MSETSVEPPSPTLGDDGEPCAECRMPLARDQRYCLNCGHRRAEARIPFLDVLREEYGGGQDEAPLVVEEPRERRTGLTPLAATGIATGVGVLLIAGVLVGLASERGGGTTAAAPAPQVVMAQAPVAAAQPVAAAELQEDWPSGKDGWTVQLQTFSKEATQVPTVTAAKQAAAAKGAPEVGALISDNYSTLDPGNYVIYSGVYDSKKQAQAALKSVKAKFPTAQVVEVSASGTSSVPSKGGDKNALSGHKKSATVDKSQLQKLQNLKPGEYQKQSRKLPDETKLPGKPPKQDGKQPGAGSSAQTIG